ncbi:MAG: hypothetical protein U0K91_02220 [Acutalibacteraceae bacterium]|nr:hypothetical protein [Acutalibacteraceae bacterium]
MDSIIEFLACYTSINILIVAERSFLLLLGATSIKIAVESFKARKYFLFGLSLIVSIVYIIRILLLCVQINISL